MRAASRVLGTLREAALLLRSSDGIFTKTRLAVAFVLVVATAVLNTLAPLAFKAAIDLLTAPRVSQTSDALFLIGIYAATLFAVRIFTELRTLSYGVGIQRLQREVCSRLYSRLLAASLKFHLQNPVGSTVQVLSSGLVGLVTVLQHLLFTLFPVVIELSVVAIVLLRLHRAEYLAIFCFAVIAYLANFIFAAARIRDAARSATAATVDAYGKFADSLQNVETIKHLTAEDVTSQRHDAAQSTAERLWRLLIVRRTAQGIVSVGVFSISVAVTLLLAAREVLHGTMTVGEFVLINTYIMRLTIPLEQVGQAVRDIAQGIASAEKLLLLLREPPEAPASEAATRHAPGGGTARGTIEFAEVSFSYSPGRKALCGVSFSVPAGRTAGIVGRSGSGKSTLVRLLLRFYAPDAGQIFLDGAPLDRWDLADLRRSIAVVAQDSVLFNDTLTFNLEVGRPGSTRADIERAVEIAHLKDYVSRLPLGYESPVGERGLKLSGGERQRVAIARSALKRPIVYVFDEATSSLDSKTEHAIMHNLTEVSAGCTTLIIAHRLSTVAHADEILVFNDGGIVERGIHSELLAADGTYAQLWRAQHRDVTVASPACGS